MLGLISRRSHEAVVDAKDQVIRVLADEVDWLRRREGSAQASVAPVVNPLLAPTKVEQKIQDEEEAIIALMESGSLTQDEFEQRITALQTMHIER